MLGVYHVQRSQEAILKKQKITVNRDMLFKFIIIEQYIAQGVTGRVFFFF